MSESRAVQQRTSGRVTTHPLTLKTPGPSEPVHAFTVDVEDWYQSCIDFEAPISERVLRNVDRVLGVLDECGVKGTFFVQGLVAETFPQLVAGLVAAGHEVQSHGYSHRPLHSLGDRELREELVRSRETVEDAAGTRVTSFRAQDFSIGTGNLSALEVLADVGFEIDSSIFPVGMKRYGISGWELAPHALTLPSGRRLIEVPVAIWELGRLRLPVAGGGYFRVLPARVLRRALGAIAADGRPGVVYTHPYEFDPNELDDYRGLVPRRYLRSQGLGRRSLVGRVRHLLATQRFGRLDDVLAAWGVT